MQNKLEELFLICTEGKASLQQQRQLMDLLQLPENQEEGRRLFQAAWNESSSQQAGIPEARLLEIKNAIVSSAEHKKSTVVYSISKYSRWIKYAAAILLLIGAYLYTTQKTKPVPAGKTQQIADVHAPVANQATITLADGRQIHIDDAQNGMLAHQGSVNIQKLNSGEIVYNIGEGSNDVQYNVLSVPRGSKVASIILSDGTKAWLNAESSLKYPTGFVEKQRKVEVSGEAYFEIAKDKNRPFIVQTRGEDIIVLGTEFNVNSYPEEIAPRISLVDGSVKIKNAVLKPGEAFAGGRVFKTNIAQDIAWKNGVFNFDDKSLKEIMQHIGRWYDLKIEYAPGIKEMEFGGEIPRNLTLLQVLKVLEGAGVHFELTNDKILRVKP